MVGDIVGTLSDTLPDDEGNDRFSVRELELVFGHDVDPYTRFDATLAFSDTGHTHVEEAFASYWNLPFAAKGRIGRMHQYIGKASVMHRDSLDTVDEPLVVQEYLGEEGYIDLAWICRLYAAFIGRLCAAADLGPAGGGVSRAAFFRRAWPTDVLQSEELGYVGLSSFELGYVSFGSKSRAKTSPCCVGRHLSATPIRSTSSLQLALLSAPRLTRRTHFCDEMSTLISS